MTSLAGKHLLPLAFGTLMVAAAGRDADGPALAAAGAALLSVVGAVWLRPAATAAVLLAVLTVVLGGPAPMFTALSGLSATAYLVLRHGAGRAAAPAVLAAVGFAAAGAVAVLLPVAVPWLPLAAPLALLAGYLLAVRPYVTGRRG
jgi:hypothetical protein